MKQDPRFPNLFITDHPLIQHKLSHMRDKSTSTRTFRELLKEITLLMGYEITRDLPLTTREIETPLMTIDAPVIAGRKLAIVPILRALGISVCSATRKPTSRWNTWCACLTWSSVPSSCATRWWRPAIRPCTRWMC
jgi:uracil phosphoribosyltransferase